MRQLKLYFNTKRNQDTPRNINHQTLTTKALFKSYFPPVGNCAGSVFQSSNCCENAIDGEGKIVVVTPPAAATYIIEEIPFMIASRREDVASSDVVVIDDWERTVPLKDGANP